MRDLSSDNLVDHQSLERVTQLAARYAADGAIGLRTGQRLNINAHGALGYAAMASENLHRAVQLLLKYYRVQAPRVHFSLHRQEDRYYLVCDPSFVLPEMPWLTAEMLVTSIYTSVEFLLSDRTQGLEVWFNHPEPSHIAAYASTFHVPVRFGQAFNGLVVPEALAMLPLLSADALASTIFEKRCEAIRQESGSERLADTIRRLQSQGRLAYRQISPARPSSFRFQPL